MPDLTTTSDHDCFCGDPADLDAFEALLSSPIRHEQRESALASWSEYKLKKQSLFVKQSPGKKGIWTKGDYIRSLTAPAIDLSGAKFFDVCLGYADLRGARFDDVTFAIRNRQWTGLKGVQLQSASLRGACISGGRLMDADLRGADLSGIDLQNADLTNANLAGARLQGARLQGSNLSRANLVGADLRGANLCGCRVYGVSAWDVLIDDDEALRRDLIVTPCDQAEVVVDNIEVAQFVYLLLTNPKIRGVIDTVCKKGVLILGRFTADRKPVLDALRLGLRQRGYVPMIFDFDKPDQRDLTETVKTLAGLSRFIIADITNPRSNPLELQATVPDYMVPLIPIIAEQEEPFPMFKDLWAKYNWVVDPLEYSDSQILLRVLDAAIIAPALKKHAELVVAKAQKLRTRKASDYAGE